MYRGWNIQRLPCVSTILKTPKQNCPQDDRTPKNTPNRGAIFQRHVAVGVPTGLKNVTLRNDDVVRQGTWQTSRPLGVSTCSFLTSGWYYTFSIVIQFNLTCCRRKNKSQVSWYCPQHEYFCYSKGQIISECPYEIIVCPKIATKKFPRFLS